MFTGTALSSNIDDQPGIHIVNFDSMWVAMIGQFKAFISFNRLTVPLGNMELLSPIPMLDSQRNQHTDCGACGRGWEIPVVSRYYFLLVASTICAFHLEITTYQLS